ncbi:MAG: ferritin family protein [Candidatus Omnitrophica bacterium]|nr:ferritin family protein [Candidatus Omnitrophota bacterium]MDD5430063.1 ferritin family protein [Candidatus Omnitrophota bacterium]
MPENFNPRQMLQAAFETEEAACRLFSSFIESSPDEALKKIWQQLDEQSSVHSKVFKQMYEDGDSYLVYEIVSGEYDPYLRSIVPEYISVCKNIEDKIKKPFSTELVAVELAVYFEIEAIITYSALKEYIVPDKLDMLNKIIGDKKKILAKLSACKRKLQKEQG